MAATSNNPFLLARMAGFQIKFTLTFNITGTEFGNSVFFVMTYDSEYSEDLNEFEIANIDISSLI